MLLVSLYTVLHIFVIRLCLGLENNNETCRNDIWDIIGLSVYRQRRRTRFGTGVEDGRPVPDVHGGRGLFGAQQLTDDRRGHHAGRVTDLWTETRSEF